MKTTQQGVAVEVMTQRQCRYAMLDVQLPRGTGKVAVAQAMERFVETGGGEYFRTASQVLVRQVLQYEKVVLPAR
ncbi:hypothetical protein D3C73_908290 [compost metagenome]